MLTPARVHFRGNEIPREEWSAICAEELGASGVQELSSHDAELWIDDAHSTDRISHVESAVEFYFEDGSKADAALAFFVVLPFVENLEKIEERIQDWHAQWKSEYQGVKLSSGWEIRPPWVDVESHGKLIVINPGSGFGTGTHETTQMCLELWDHVDIRSKSVLDFGSGSGILSIAAAKAGAVVSAVEVDPLATDNAIENAALNSVSSSIRFFSVLHELATPQYRIVFANVLKHVLLDFADALVGRISREPGSLLILSGLLEQDLIEIEQEYGRLFALHSIPVKSHQREKAEWRAIAYEVIST